MRSPWFAVSSLVLCLALAAHAETRPRYGGTLRIETAETITVLPTGDTWMTSHLGANVFGLLSGVILCTGGCEGTPGPFKVAQFVPGKKLTLIANDDYEHGRPFLDAIEITMGRSPRDQLLDLQLGRTDVIDIPADSIRRVQQGGTRIAASKPLELVAIVFTNDDPKLREALSLSIDRAAIFNVLLGRQGAPSTALLPNWMTGYGFVFDTNQDVQRAKQLRQQSRRMQAVTLGYDPGDPLGRSIAERIALDARAAGIAITPSPSGAPDARLVRVVLLETDPQGALAELAKDLGLKIADLGHSPEQWYVAESDLIDRAHIVPLLHLPIAYGLSPRVKDFPNMRWGGWAPLENVWLEQKP